MNDVDALRAAGRLQAMGIAIKSPSLMETAQKHSEFVANGGNRAMRRATKRARRRKGH